METDFTKYPAQELIGKKILYVSDSINDPRRRITTIEKVTKTAFRIKIKNYLGQELISDELFNLSNGCKKGGHDRSSWGSISRCYLLSDQQVIDFKAQWARDKESRMIKEEITKRIDTFSYDQLKQIEAILNINKPEPNGK